MQLHSGPLFEGSEGIPIPSAGCWDIEDVFYAAVKGAFTQAQLDTCRVAALELSHRRDAAPQGFN